MSFDGAVIAAGFETPYRRRATGVTTQTLLRDALLGVCAAAGLAPGRVDGLAVAAFTLGPDKAVDLAWKLGLKPRWIMEDTNGGASGINMLHHAARAVQAGDAEAIVLLAGDHFVGADFQRLTEGYNATVRDHLAPLPFGGPNGMFALVTLAMMRAEGMERADFGRLCVAQRGWAAGNANAVYRKPLTLQAYLAAPPVAEPLGMYDCVPVVSGADAILVTRPGLTGGPQVTLRALRARHNWDDQSGDGLVTGLAQEAEGLWHAAGRGPEEMQLAQVYDDYPVMALVQLRDLGLTGALSLPAFVAERIATRALPVNTSGGQLSAGQAGAAGGLHGLVEAVAHLTGRAGDRQVPGARRAIVSGYGMVAYRYCLCANAVVLEAGS